MEQRKITPNFPTYQEYIGNRDSRQSNYFLLAPILAFLGNSRKALMYDINDPKPEMIESLGRDDLRVPKPGVQIVEDANGHLNALFYGENIEEANKIAKEYDLSISGDSFHKTDLKNLSNILGFS